MTDIAGMTTLLQKMRQEQPSDAQPFTDSQVKAVVEILIPRLVTTMPGLPPGMSAEFVERTDKSWTIKITRP